MHAKQERNWEKIVFSRVWSLFGQFFSLWNWLKKSRILWNLWILKAFNEVKCQYPLHSGQYLCTKYVGQSINLSNLAQKNDHVTSPQARYNPAIFILRILEVKAASVNHGSHFCRAVQNWAKSVEMAKWQKCMLNKNESGIKLHFREFGHFLAYFLALEVD